MPRPRFSLRTLLLLALLAGSALTVHFYWEPWFLAGTVTNVTGFTDATPRCLIQTTETELRVLDLATQQVRGVMTLADFERRPVVVSSGHAVFDDDGGNIRIVSLRTQQKHELKSYAERNTEIVISPSYAERHAEIVITPNDKWLLISHPPAIYDLAARQVVFRDARADTAVRVHTPDEAAAAMNLRQAAIAAAHRCQALPQLQQALARDLPIHFWFSTDGGILLSSVDFETVQVWDTTTGLLRHSVTIGRQNSGFTCHVSPNGGRVAVGVAGQTTIYDASTSTVLLTVPRPLIPNKRDRCDASGQRWQFVRPNTMEAYSKGKNERRVEIYDVRLGLMSALESNDPFASAEGLCLSEDGARLFFQEKFAIVSSETGAVLYQFPVLNTDNPFAPRLVENPPIKGFVDERIILQGSGSDWHIYERRRDESLLGLLQRPEGWLTLLCAIALLASLRADYRSLRAKPTAPQPAPDAKEAA